MLFIDLFKKQLGTLYANLENKIIIDKQSENNNEMITIEFYNIIIKYMIENNKNIEEIDIDDFDIMFNNNFMKLYENGIIREKLYSFIKNPCKEMSRIIFLFTQMNFLIKIKTNALPEKYNNI